MLPTSQIAIFLKKTQPCLQDIVFELRNIIVSVAPYASETILWKGLSYYDQGRGGPVSAGICQISVCEDHVRLGFVHGAFLPDPKALLEGDRKYKRFIRLHSYEATPWDYLKELIACSARFDPYTLQFR